MLPQKIFVGNIKSGTEEESLKNLFETYGEVLGVDIINNYAFVHMVNESEAIEAVQNLHNSLFEGKYIRCALSTKESQGKHRLRQINEKDDKGPQKIFVGNIKSGTSEFSLRGLFEQYGTVSECVIINNYGFVHMPTMAEACDAVDSLNKSLFEGKVIRCELSTRYTRNKKGQIDYAELDSSGNVPQKIFVGNIKSGASQDELRALFEKFGTVTACDIINNYGFVHMPNREETKKAIENLHRSVFAGQVIRCEIASKPSSKKKNTSLEYSDGPQKIFVGNVQDPSKVDKLQAAFERFGEVSDCVILKGFAFVHMSEGHEAAAAVEALHNAVFDGRTIRCEISRKKNEDRGGATSSQPPNSISLDPPYGVKDSYREALVQELLQRDEYLRQSYESRQAELRRPSHLSNPWQSMNEPEYDEYGGDCYGGEGYGGNNFGSDGGFGGGPFGGGGYGGGFGEPEFGMPMGMHQGGGKIRGGRRGGRGGKFSAY